MTGSTPPALEPPQPTVTWAGIPHDLASAGEELLYQFGVGLGFLATVRSDGGPRVHPMCPLLHEAGLYGFLVPSPKRGDLLRDGRFSIHSFPSEENEDAFYITGRARMIEAPDIRDALLTRYLEERPKLSPELGRPRRTGALRVPHRHMSADPHERPRRPRAGAYGLARPGLATEPLSRAVFTQPAPARADRRVPRRTTHRDPCPG